MVSWLLLGHRDARLALLSLWLGTAAVAALYHHGWREFVAADDISRFATPDPQPVKLRGVLDDEPVSFRQPADDPLRSISRPDSTRAVLRCTAVKQQDDWVPASGRAQLEVAGLVRDLHVGDEVEVDGRLVQPHPAMNPGEADYSAYLRDQRIRAIVVVRKTPAAVVRQSEGWPWSFSGWFAMLRHTGQRALQDALPPETSGVAAALLLGEDSAMTRDDWDRYIQTGVIHVLAISGQHLVVLAGGLWLVLRLLGVRRRRGVLAVMAFLVGYAFLTGNQPPVLRSAVMVCVYGVGLLLRRPPLLANSFALGWLAVMLVNPTDVFTPGCQLSFLAVAILYWGTSRWLRREFDPLERLVEEARPAWQKAVRWVGRQVVVSYAITLAVWLAAAPLVAARYHLVSPAGLLIGPPVVLLTSIALMAGFLLLLASLAAGPLVPVLALVSRCSLGACDVLVNVAQRLPGAYWYVGDIPEWWLVVFYGVLLTVLVHETLIRHWRWALPAGVAWVCVGLLTGWARPASEELRCTFLAVGHGGCTVLETQDGRTLLYDAGALGGPDVTRRQIAPFLWHRGVRRIDEVFLSHA
jgi:competence protein ComEC